MKKGQASRTAQAAAALRANHILHTDQPVFDDPYALQMTSQNWRRALHFTPFKNLINSGLFNRTLGRLTGQVVARSRFSEDLLLDALKNKNIRQYVIIGAGLDSFSLRLAEHFPQLTVFEVDHPDTQNLKIKQLQSIRAIPSNIEFVPIDFQTESLKDALSRSSLQNEQATFFSWLGTTHYLTPATTINTLANLSTWIAPNSELVMDYSIDYHTLPLLERLGSLAVAEFTRLLKEPLIGAFEPTALHRSLQNMDFEVVEDLDGHEITQRYFQNRSDHIQHTHATRLIHLRKI